MGPGKPWNKGREKDREHSHPPPKKRQGRGTTGRNIGPGKPWNKGGEKDRALASPTLSGPKTDREGGQVRITALRRVRFRRREGRVPRDGTEE
jgi:hypothetical protein